MKKIIILLLISSNCWAINYNNAETIRKIGDWTQITNPVIAGVLASQERGALHFGAHMAQTQLAIELGKLTGRKWKYKGSLRPDGTSRNGMPSGHTAAAWVAAAYTREHSTKYEHLVIPMYGVAIFTGASRVISKRHTALQALIGAVISEMIVSANAEMKWCKTYVGYDAGEVVAGINIRL